jgi:poly-gamma-glutamate synthesis protein (capsule biosynthesis protein)
MQKSTLKTEAVNSVTVVGLESRVLFAGDVYWGRAVNKWSQSSPLKEAYPFSRLNEFGREQYDAWVANLECPSVPGVNQPYSFEAEKLLFNCPATYLTEASKWFTAFSLANNHTNNQGGQAGLDATRAALESHAIQYFGHYDPQKLADVCEVIALPARVQQSDAIERKASIPVALCGYHGLAATPPAESLAVMQQYAKVMPVVAYSHMGAEYTALPDNSRRALYRRMIDNGADAVMAAHPHWVQPVEVYKGKLVAYSLGNFIFDQKPGETQRGAVIDLTLKITGKAAASKALTAWVELGESCKAFRDRCLAKAAQQRISRPQFSFEYAARGVDMSNQITKPATPALNDAILERLKWVEATSQLEAGR